MFAHDTISIERCIDTDASPEIPFQGLQSLDPRARPEHLQQLIEAFGEILQAQNAPAMATILGSKIIDTRGFTGNINIDRKPANRLLLTEQIEQALRMLETTSADMRRVAFALRLLVDQLDWYTDKTGPYASVNFARGHAHGLLIGPDGIEERSDVRVGVTIMAPYTRFPDHELTTSRLVLALSDGEFWSECSGWWRSQIGAAICQPVGGQFAMRCGARPFLMLWCQ